MKASLVQKAEAEADPSEEESGGRQTHRSPNFPFIALEKAVERAKQLHEAQGRHAVRLDIAAKDWHYNPKSSGVLQTVGALRMYGLITVEAGSGMSRTIRLTDRALRILLDKRPDEHQKALRDAALAPKLFADLWQKWGSDMPSRENAESHLTVDLGFNPTAAPTVFAAYKRTIEYAKPVEAATLSGDATDSGANEEQEAMPETGAEERRTAPQSSPKPPSQPATMQGEEEHFRLKLAGGRTVRVLFQGEPPTQAEIEKLISLLQLQKDQYPVQNKSD